MHDALGGVPGDRGVAGRVHAHPLVAGDTSHGAAQNGLHADGPRPTTSGAGAREDGDGVGEPARLRGAVVEVEQVGEDVLVAVPFLHGTQVGQHPGGQRLHPAGRVGHRGDGGGTLTGRPVEPRPQSGGLLGEARDLLGPLLGKTYPLLLETVRESLPIPVELRHGAGPFTIGLRAQALLFPSRPLGQPGPVLGEPGRVRAGRVQQAAGGPFPADGVHGHGHRRAEQERRGARAQAEWHAYRGRCRGDGAADDERRHHGAGQGDGQESTGSGSVAGAGGRGHQSGPRQAAERPSCRPSGRVSAGRFHAARNRRSLYESS